MLPVVPISGADQQRTAKKNSAQTLKKGLFSLFDRELAVHDQSAQSPELEIDVLRKEIEESGEKLEKEPTLPNFTRFRDALSRLAKRINSEAYKLEKFGGTATNPRYYEIITVIDREADRLYELIMQEHKNRMAITAKVIGIKGLVVDLVG